MKARCIKGFTTKGIEHKVDDEWNVNKEECALLLSQRLCVMVREEVAKEKATPKKKKEKATL